MIDVNYARGRNLLTTPEFAKAGRDVKRGVSVGVLQRERRTKRQRDVALLFEEGQDLDHYRGGALRHREMQGGDQVVISHRQASPGPQ